MATKLIVTLRRGLAGKNKNQIAVIRALGLGKTGSTTEKPDNPSVRGMIAKVAHLVDVKEA